MIPEPPIRLPTLLKASNGRSCIRCGANDGTVVRAHYNGQGQHRLGKGMKVKPHDFASADFCHSCHSEFDGYQGKVGYERSWEFAWYCLLTLERDFREGLLVENSKGDSHKEKL